jgi:hypothetical protein
MDLAPRQGVRLMRGKGCWLDMGKGSPGCFEGGMAAGGIRARVSREPRGYWGKKFRWVVNGSCARPQAGVWRGAGGRNRRTGEVRARALGRRVDRPNRRNASSSRECFW